MLSVHLDENLLRKYLDPIYDRLASLELLKRCERKGTQNANECLHSVIWSRLPKEMFFSKDRIEFCIYKGVSEFNFGPFLNPSISRLYGLSVSDNSICLGENRAKKRLYNAARAVSKKAASMRQKVRQARRRRLERLEQLEGGPAYASGAAPLPSTGPAPKPKSRPTPKPKSHIIPRNMKKVKDNPKL